MVTPVTAEALIQKYGEEYRILITKALEWLEEEEPKWGLDRPIRRDGYIRDLVSHAKRSKD
jgi:hypothetical protein